MLALSSISAFAAVPPQTTQDRAEGNRLVINGKPVFISGMNIAWNNFARDVGDNNVSINSFVNQFKQIKGAGGNAVRWWLHTDAQVDPKMDSDGKVTGIGSKTISNIREVLDSAYNYGIVVSLTLFSFDLLDGEEGKSDSPNKTTAQVARNEKFLTVPANLDTYIEKALRPILEAVGSHPAIMCWEVFNEPEGMANELGWASRKIDHSHIMRFINKIAGEVHRKTKKMASSGIHNFSAGERALYSAAKLKAAGGDNDGYLDFYMAHYYPEYGGTSESPFHHPASYWGMDKPVLIGEFPAQSWGPGTGYSSIQNGTAMTIENAFEYAYDNGYCGAMSWSMTESNPAKFGNFATTKPALENLFAKHKADIEINDVEIVVPTGDLAMKLALANLPKEVEGVGPWNELSTSKDASFTGKTNFTFEMYIEPGSGTNLMIVPAVKDANWTWSPAQSESFTLAGKPQGEWFTVTIPVSAFQASEAGKTFNPASVKEFVIQYFAKDANYTGTILFDNFKIDNTVLFNFNEVGSEWNTTAEGASVSLVARPGTNSILKHSTTINLSTLDFSKAQVYDIHGKRVFANSFAELKNGVYIVKVNGVAKKFSVSR
jgi:hypothetical protein